MGGTPSKGQAEIRFEDSLEAIKNEEAEKIPKIIELSYALSDLAFISNIEIQHLFLNHRQMFKLLITQTIDNMLSNDYYKSIQGSIHICAKIIPVMALSINDPNELDWLFVGEKCEFSRLLASLKSLLFIPLVFNQQNAEDPMVWFAGIQLMYNYESTRADAMHLLFFGHAGSFFFPNNPEIQEQNVKFSCLEPNVAKLLVNSITECIIYHNSYFMSFAIPYVCIALCNDDNFRKALFDSNLLSALVDLAYISIENLNAKLFSSFQIEAYETDVLLACFLCFVIIFKNNMFEEENSIEAPNEDDEIKKQISNQFNHIQYDPYKTVISSIHYLQLANETKQININHRITLTILSVITSTKENGKLFQNPLENIILGTKYSFQNSSIALAILEAVSNCSILENSGSVLPLIISVVHNIAPFIADTKKAIQCLSKIIDLSVKSEQVNLFNEIAIIIERYIHGEGDANTKVSEITPLVEALSLKNPGLKNQLDDSIKSSQLQHDYPLVLEGLASHLNWARSITIQLFQKKNKINLERIRRNSDAK